VLRRTPYGHQFPRQIGYVDACANLYESLSYRFSSGTWELPHGDLVSEIEQVFLLAADTGEQVRDGVFSKAVLDALKARANQTSEWPPDSDAIVADAKAKLENQQRPIKISWKTRAGDVSTESVGRLASAFLGSDAAKSELVIKALDRYREERVAEWSDLRYGAGEKLFTQLCLLFDKGQAARERWVQEKEKHFASLAELLTENPGYPAIVLLGEPGSGKSTLLRRLDLDIADANRGSAAKGKFSYFVSLRDYRGAPGASPPDPLRWLRDKWAGEWKSRYSDLPELDELLRDESYLLLDALNEMPVRATSDYQAYQVLVDGWAAFISNVKKRFPKCRMVFSCRSLDYSASLSSSDIQVPHVEIARLDKLTIRKFLDHYVPENADRLFQEIEASDLGLYSTAYFLKMLCDLAARTGEIPQDRAALFTAFVRELLRREYDKRTPLLVSPGLLDQADLARLALLFAMSDPLWRSPYELPEEGPMFSQLAILAHDMQDTGATSDNSQVVASYDDVVQRLTPALGQVRAKQLIEAGCALTILEYDRLNGTVQFIHQLVQEYFAARRFAIVPEPQRVQMPWLKSDVSLIWRKCVRI
jgi:hypothetical protein